MFEGSFMCAPIGGRSGPVGAHPRKRGGTARTLAGSVRYDDVNYTAIGEVAYLFRKSSWSLAVIHRPLMSADQPHRPIQQKRDRRWCAVIGGRSGEEEPLTISRHDVMIAFTDEVNNRGGEQWQRS